MRTAALALLVAMVVGASGTAAADPKPARGQQVKANPKPAAQAQPADGFFRLLVEDVTSRPLRLGQNLGLLRGMGDAIRLSGGNLASPAEASAYEQMLGLMAADFRALIVEDRYR